MGRAMVAKISTGNNLLGLGIYTPAEAAHYARVTTQMMTRWIHGTRTAAAVVCAQLPDDDERTVTFLDFVQALTIRAIRRERNVPLQKIREAVATATEHYNVPYPFAVQHRTFLYDNDIHIELPTKSPGHQTVTQISGQLKGQTLIREIAEPHLEDLSFSGGLASCYKAFEAQGRNITLDPTRRFGQPMVDNCDYSVAALLHAYQTEGSVRAAAEALGVSNDDVLMAIRYDDHLRGNSAA
ncbi:MAG: hypothetical protein JXO22_10855 [Phycisphaerae bacterium]|nr:hypothetical protein [Phycisphaerae bacterium]